MIPNPEPMKLCRDCNNRIEAQAGLRYSKCKVSPIPADTFMALVTGETITDEFKYCAQSREHGPCTPSAKLFEPKCVVVESNGRMA